MTVTPAVLKHRSGRIDRDGIEYYTYRYHVVSDTLNESEVAVANAVNVPALWSAHPFNANARCVDKSMDQMEDRPMLWEVTVQYDTKPFEKGSTSNTQGDTSQQTAPDDRPPVIVYDSQSLTVPMETDYSVPPKRILNTVGIPFDPLPTEELTIGVIRITYETTTYDPAARENFENHCNVADTTINGVEYPAGYLLCKKFRGNSQFENATGKVWKVELEFWDHPRKRWDDLKLLNAGTMAYPSALSDAPEQCIDDKGSQITQPVPLDEDGVRIYSRDPDDFINLPFTGKPSADFTAIAPFIT